MPTALVTAAPVEPRSLPLSPPLGLLALIGNTPMIDLSTLLGKPGVRILAKAEFANPGGSVKDRPALAMIDDAERRGLFAGGRRLLDATSGNTGIAYAMIGAARGIAVTLCLPASASHERKCILKAYGAELLETDPLAGSDGAILEARRLVAENPDRYAYLDQYSNPENWRAHFRSTGPEILAQAGSDLAAFVAGLGTSGTFVGVSRYLREHAPAVRRISLEPDSPFHGLEGMKHMESAIVPPIYDPSLAHENREISTEAAHAMVRRLAREAGLRVGVSAGANVASALAVATEIERGSVVTVLCDNADKYLTERFWDDGDNKLDGVDGERAR